MAVSMKYRTQGSLPISSQHKAQYIPKIPEEPEPSTRGKAKDAPLLRGHSDEDRIQQSIPKIQRPFAPKPEGPPARQPEGPPAPKLEGPRFRMPPHDPSKAIIETSPYYIYFKIVTTKDTKMTQDKDLKSVLSDLIIIDKDLPKTAKYRHFRSYEQ